jgi:hypothetical protein
MKTKFWLWLLLVSLVLGIIAAHFSQSAADWLGQQYDLKTRTNYSVAVLLPINLRGFRMARQYNPEVGQMFDLIAIENVRWAWENGHIPYGAGQVQRLVSSDLISWPLLQSAWPEMAKLVKDTALHDAKKLVADFGNPTWRTHWAACAISELILKPIKAGIITWQEIGITPKVLAKI